MKRIASIAMLLVSLPVACVTEQPSATWIEAMPGPVGLYCNHGREGWLWAGRIVDAMTGLPIPGAVVYQVPERSRPTGGEFWFDAKWTADRDGFVRLRQEEKTGSSWFIVDAEGYGPIAEMDAPPTIGDADLVSSLMPGIDWPVAVHDMFDRPLAGVEVGLCIGCGHTPDVRVARTGSDGKALLRSVEPTKNRVSGDSIRDLYPRGDGLDPTYLDDASWRAGDPPTVLRPDVARPVSGRVLGPNGRPLPRIPVRSHGLHRGPWTWTDGEGRFRLGSSRDEQIWLHVGGREYHARLPATAQAMDLVLPVSPLPKGQPTGRVAVTVRDAATSQPLAGAKVEVWHTGIQSESRAEATTWATDEKGVFETEVTAGTVGVRVKALGDEDQTLLTHDIAVRDVQVAADAEVRVLIELTRRPTVSVRLAENTRNVALVTREGRSQLDARVAEQQVPVPAQATFAFVVGSDEWRGHHYFTFDAPPKETVVLRPLGPLRVRLRVIDGAGQPVAAMAWTGHDYDFDPERDAKGTSTDANGVVELAVTGRTGVFVRIRPEHDGLRDTDVLVATDKPGADRLVDLGDLRLLPRDRPCLRVLRAEGTPAAGQLRLLRPGLRMDGALASDGGWDGIAPRAGDRIEVRLDEARDSEDTEQLTLRVLPVTARLVGSWPWQLQQASGAIVLDVHDDAGFRPEDVVVFYGDQCVRADRRLELRGLPDDDLELFVGAAGCDSARVRLRLLPAEKRAVNVVLHRR